MSSPPWAVQSWVSPQQEELSKGPTPEQVLPSQNSSSARKDPNFLGILGLGRWDQGFISSGRFLRLSQSSEIT